MGTVTDPGSRLPARPSARVVPMGTATTRPAATELLTAGEAAALHAADAHPGPIRGGQGQTGHQSAAAHGGDHGGEAGHLIEQLEGDGPLAGDDVGIVVGRDEPCGATEAVGQRQGVGFGLLVGRCRGGRSRRRSARGLLSWLPRRSRE